MPRFLVALLFLLVLPSAARAYEDQIVLEVGAGYQASFGTGDLIPYGAHVDVGALLGISPTLSLGFRLDGGVLHDDDATVYFASTGAELVYAIDIVTAVPRFGFGVRPLLSSEPGGLALDLGLDLALGVDFLPRSGPNYGIELRATFLPLDQNSELGPLLLALTFRVGFPFER